MEDVDPITQRARLSYRRAATLFEEHTTAMKRGPFRVRAAGDGGYSWTMVY